MRQSLLHVPAPEDVPCLSLAPRPHPTLGPLLGPAGRPPLRVTPTHRKGNQVSAWHAAGAVQGVMSLFLTFFFPVTVFIVAPCSQLPRPCQYHECKLRVSKSQTLRLDGGDATNCLRKAHQPSGDVLLKCSEEKVKVLSQCPILFNPSDCSPPGSSVHGILQARILEWVARPLLQGTFPLPEMESRSYTL